LQILRYDFGLTNLEELVTVLEELESGLESWAGFQSLKG
jgi:hypothetical protein